ncbi:hypothetical protein [Faecalibacterium prausnitzii]|uniref:hypothetical protein n=1 Tax=Faecalibacterium prausnitzii TaxID=853 RepID=UPI003988F44E
MDCIQLSLFWKTYPEPFPATTETTSGQFWKNLPAWSNQTLLFLDLRGGADGAKLEQSLETDGLWRGDSWTVNISEWPSAESVSLLSSTLEVNAPEKYYLSARACQGILTRASRRGKKLPDLLQTALLEMIEWWEPGSSAAVVEMLIAEERRRTEQEKAKQRKERVVTNAVKQLRTRLKSVQGAPVVERAHLCRQKKLERYRRSKTKRSSN